MTTSNDEPASMPPPSDGNACADAPSVAGLTAVAPPYEVETSVLVVDDDPNNLAMLEDCVDIRDLLGHLIEEWGHTVIGAVGSGREAIERLHRLRPDVAIVDIDLPDLDGYEVARRIHAELGDERPRLIAVSGYGQDHAQQRAFEAGFDVMLVKPPDPEALRETIEGVCERREAIPASPRCVVH